MSNAATNTLMRQLSLRLAGNAGPEVKAAADYVTDDVERDGLYNAFAHLQLL